jgi:hypothetical protein
VTRGGGALGLSLLTPRRQSSGASGACGGLL